MQQSGNRTAQETLLRISGLGVTFNKTVHAVRDLTLECCVDDFIVVLGPSGAGKSTFLRSLNRLNKPTGGSVHFLGEDVTNASGRSLRRLRQSVGMVFQQFNLVGRRSVLQNVLAGRLCFSGGLIRRPMSWLGLFREEDQEIAFDALQRVGIPEKAYARADELSGGQQQRVAIARLIAQQPAVVLADEPIASLDPASAESVMRLLRELHDQDGIPVIVNLHQVDVARRFAKRVIGMNAGRVVFDGPPAELDEKSLAKIYAGEDPEQENAPLPHRIKTQANPIKQPTKRIRRTPMHKPDIKPSPYVITLFALAMICSLPLLVVGCGDSSASTEITGREDTTMDRTGWPEKLRFGVIPTEGGADTTERYAPLKEILSRELGIPVEVQSASSYQGVVTAMANDQIEVAWLGPKSYIEAAKRADAEALLLELNSDGKAGYHAIFIVPADSPIQTLEDAKGKRFAFTDPNSTSGYLIPSIVLIDEIGQPADEYFGEVNFSGSHGTSVLQIASKELEIAATNDLDYGKMVDKGSINENAVRVIHTSELIPGAPISVRRELPESFKQAVKKAMLTINDMPEVQERFQNGGYIDTTDEAYDIIRAADAYLTQQKQGG